MDIPDKNGQNPFRRVVNGLMARILWVRSKSDKIGFLCLLLLAIGLLAVKSSPSEGQKSIFNVFFEKYIEETAASIVGPTTLQLAEINSFLSGSGMGNGSGQEQVVNRQNLATIQENSLISYNSVTNDTGEIEKQTTGKTSQISIYVVQEGDTLSFIAEDYGVSMNTIIWANNLKNINYLKPGTELKIPPVTGIVHMVKNGETISSIAKKYDVEQDKILAYNLLPKVDQIKVGQEIIVPGGTLNVGLGTATTASVTRFAYLPDLSGYFAQPTSGRNWGIIHGRNGVDIANSCGTVIYAAAEGQVNLATGSGWNGGYGQFIRINHPNGTETLYAHLSRVLVSTGESVQKGKLIAMMGTTGRSTGCHLHFEVHGAQNPLARY